MNARVLLAAVGGAVSNFLVGWVVYGMLLMDYMKANTVQYAGLMKEPPNLVIMFISGFFWALTYAYIFHRWAGIKDFKSGMMAGMVISILYGLAIDLQFLAMMNLYVGYTVILVDVAASTVMGSIMGGVVGLILGMGNKETATA